MKSKIQMLNGINVSNLAFAFMVCLLLASINGAEAQLSWVRYNGSTPANAVKGGFENGQTLMVARANFSGVNHPGKMVNTHCNIGYGGKEVVVRQFEILTSNNTKLRWIGVIKNRLPDNAVVAGTENGQPLYVGRAKRTADGSVHPGKVFKADGRYICNYGWGGKEVTEKNSFEVLVSYKTELNKPAVDFYFTTPNGWSMNKHVRTMGDINGDGKDDIVGFGEGGVFVSFSDGANFSVPKMLMNNFAIGAGGWKVSEHTRTTGDVNGDGKDDIIGFGGGAVLVSLSTGNGLKAATVWLDHYFTAPNGWNNKEHVRTVADVNGDGKADLVGFGGTGVFVSFSNGRSFSKPELLVNNLAIGAGGWEVSKHTRLLADINNDNRADLVGFGGQVYTVFSNGNNFGSMTERGQNFYTNPNWWNLKKAP